MIATRLRRRVAAHKTRLGWLGVDVGSCAVKLAQIERRPGGWSVRHASLTDVPPGADPLEVAAEAISVNVASRPLRVARLAACVVTQHVDLHNVDMPAAELGDVETAAGHQVTQESQSNVVTYWPSTWDARDDADQPMHLLRFDQDAANRLSQRLGEQRVECRVLDCLPFSLARSVALAGDATNDPAAVIDCAGNTPMFTIVRNGRPYFTRQLRCGGFAAASAAICDRTGLGPHELKCLLSEIGRVEVVGHARQKTIDFIRDVAAEHCNRFLTELDRTRNYLEVEGCSLLPNRIWLVGGGALLPGLAHDVSETLSAPTRVWNLLLPDHAPVASAQPWGSVYATAMSLSAIPLL